MDKCAYCDNLATYGWLTGDGNVTPLCAVHADVVRDTWREIRQMELAA